MQLQRVVEGETQGRAGNQQKAQFFLGKSLYHLSYYQSALAVFDEISQLGKGHLFFDQTLQWLAQLASQLPEPAGIIEKVGRYDLSQIEQFNNGEGKAVLRAAALSARPLQVHAGRVRAGDRAVREGARRRTSGTSQARMFTGHLAHSPAPGPPRDSGVPLDHRGARRGRARGRRAKIACSDLAWLSLARVYYTAANKVDDETGEREVDGTLLGAAVDAWSRIDTDSEYWLDALFEGSFAFFLADEFSRALGNIHTIFSPYFEDSYYPEALVLKSVVFFYNCQMENATAMVTKFHERYDPVQTELQRQARRVQGQRVVLQVPDQGARRRGEPLARHPRHRVDGAVGPHRAAPPRVREAARGRREALKEAPAAFKNSSVGARILQDIALAKSFAVEQTGDLARGRYNASASKSFRTS